MSEEQRGKISGNVSGRAAVLGQIANTGGISGNIGFGYACRNILSRTTDEWNAERDLIAKKNTIYVYTDYSKDREGKDVPNIKIGDGKAYLIDMPFAYSGGVTQEQIEFWNNKIAVRLDDEDLENMVFYTD
jgi:hypothetical protein